MVYLNTVKQLFCLNIDENKKRFFRVTIIKNINLVKNHH